MKPPASGGAGTQDDVLAPFAQAREHAERNVPVARPGDTRADVLRLLSARRWASAGHVAVCAEDGRFLGLLRLEDLLNAREDARAMDLMDPDPPRVANGVDREIAAWKAVHHGETALAVVETDGRFVGFILPVTLLRVLLQEHEEDISRLGGYLKSTARARASALEKVLARFWHRLPWLLLGLLGAAASAGIVARFEASLGEGLALAFFMPGIIYLADAVGTQTETVIVRGMSVGVRLRQVVLREILTGACIGAVLAAASGVVLAIVWSREVALGVGLSVFAACSTASATAMLLPWALSQLGIDPAYGSGPLATVIQDLMSLALYFIIATRFI